MNSEASPRPRILITRTRRQASALAAQLEALGAEPILIPTIEVVPPASFAPLDAAITSLSHAENDYDWLIFTSANAVQALVERASTQSRQLHPKRIAAIGPATKKAADQAGLKPLSDEILLPTSYIAESLSAALLEQPAHAQQHYLLVRAEEARDFLPATLEAAGHRVTIAPAYRNITPPGTLLALQDLFASPGSYPHAITFTSSSTASNLIMLLESIGHTISPVIALASIGPMTSATLRDHGYEPTIEAAEPTVESLANAIAAHLRLTPTERPSP